MAAAGDAARAGPAALVRGGSTYGLSCWADRPLLEADAGPAFWR